MTDAAQDAQQSTPVSATQASPTAGSNDGYTPVLTGAAAVAGETLRLGHSTIRAAGDVVSSAAGPALVLVAAGFLAARWMRRR